MENSAWDGPGSLVEHLGSTTGGSIEWEMRTRLRELETQLAKERQHSQILRERYANIQRENERLRLHLNLAQPSKSTTPDDSFDQVWNRNGEVTDLEPVLTARRVPPPTLHSAENPNNPFYEEDSSQYIKERYGSSHEQPVFLIPGLPSPTLGNESALVSRSRIAETGRHRDVMSNVSISEYSTFEDGKGLPRTVQGHHDYVASQQSVFDEYPTERIFSTAKEHESALRFTQGDSSKNTHPGFFRHGIRFCPLSPQQTFRTVIIDALPNGTTLQGVMRKIRAGPVFSAQMLDTRTLTGGPTVLVVFVFAVHAKVFVNSTKEFPFGFGPDEPPARVTLLTSPTWPIESSLTSAIFSSTGGISRCIHITCLPHNTSAAVLHSELQLAPSLRWGEYDGVQELSLSNDQREAFIVFESIPAAQIAFRHFVNRAIFTYCNLSFALDPCGAGPSSKPLRVTRERKSKKVPQTLEESERSTIDGSTSDLLHFSDGEE